MLLLLLLLQPLHVLLFILIIILVLILVFPLRTTFYRSGKQWIIFLLRIMNIILAQKILQY